MSDALDILWARGNSSLPLCDIPWFGRTVVLSSGSFQFCCFSDAEVGNVNEQSFEDIWTGPAMQRIRHTLAHGELPPECQTASCPVFRDQSTNKLVPMFQRLPRDVVQAEGLRSTQLRRWLAQSELSLASSREESQALPTLRAGDHLLVSLVVRLPERQVRTDRYLALKFPDASLRFLPHGDERPLPYVQRCLTTGEDRAMWDLPITADAPPGQYEVGAALFEPKTSPGFAANCYWSQVKSFQILGEMAREISSGPVPDAVPVRRV